ncbi:DUF1569 domain-containing protein [Membranihabitans maritimus]|uniref:DUF1569 domain-containing protein n=1 Tax=Membranihabitans maritimus TaxID=2904244 RepID=UPI001F2F0197|nr:DUF1569 domain-containing protein [Membranihabitans maritimus]
MKTIFENQVRDKLIERISRLSEKDEADWGKMNVFQMVKHNTYWNGWILGTEDHTYRQAFLGKIFGKIALRKMIKDEKPLDKNVPTSAQFKVKEKTGDFNAEKIKWISLIREYENFENPRFVHDFFGKMSNKQIGILVYKHTDHHLRQFNV